MKNILLLFILLIPAFLFAQYPATGNKQRLGYQTTGDGLIWRGVAADTAIKPRTINNAYFQLDTVNRILRRYIATQGGWQVVGATPNLSVYALKTYVDSLYATDHDRDSTNEIQTLFFDGGTGDLSISDGNNVSLLGLLNGYTSGTGTAGRLPYWNTTTSFADSPIAYNSTTKRTTWDSPGIIELPMGTDAQRPTATTSDFWYNTTGNGPEWYQGSRWAKALESTANRFTTGSIIFADANGQATQDNANFNYTGNIFTTRRATVSGIVAQFGSSTAADNMIIESLTGNTNAGKKTWRIGAPSQEGGAIESLSGNGGLAIYANRNLGNTGMMMRGGYQDNLWIVGYGGVHEGYNIYFRVNNNNRVAMSIAADENINFASAGPNGVPNRSATNLRLFNDRTYNNKGIDILSTLSATQDNQTVAAYTGLPTFVNQSTSIRTTTTISAGTGLTNGTYTNVPLNNGTGFGATANITVSGGVIASFTLVNGGAGYAVNDNLSPAAAVIGNGNTATIRVSTIGTSSNPVFAIFHGRQSATGQNYYNVLAEGTAKNYFKGDFIVGSDSTLKYNLTTGVLKLRTDVLQVENATDPNSGILEVSDPFGSPGLVSRSSSSAVANRGMTFLSTDAGIFTFIAARRNNADFRTIANADTLGWGMGDLPYKKNATLTIATHRHSDTTLAIRSVAGGGYLGLFLNSGMFQLNTYGTGAREAADLSKTESVYSAWYATDGTVIEKRANTEQYFTITSTSSPQTLSNTISDNLINQGGTQATFTLTFPASPVDGQVLKITYNNAITTLTLDGNGNTIVGSAVTTGVAGSQRAFKFYTGIGWIKLY